MRILVLGGDGYLGWPTCMHLADKGHDVVAVDNFHRRLWDLELGADSLIPIRSLHDRAERWAELGKKPIRVVVGDITDWEVVEHVFRQFEPETIIHYAEHRAAPFSMLSRRHALLTQANNAVGTLNVLFAMRDLARDAHLVKLGSMGEYGWPNIDIEEGFLEVEHNGRKDTVIYPKRPPSFYHLTKVNDSYTIDFVCNAWGLRATDLNQGIVYGVHTWQTDLHPDLATRFDYDDVWGTALNRFCVQAAIDHPITVYGKGGQTRGFLDIRDTMQCVELAVLNPPAAGEYRVFNQFTEQFSIQGLAEMVAGAATSLGWSPIIENIANPRVEPDEHYYNAKHTKLLDLGLQPHLLSDTLIHGMLDTVKAHADRVKRRLLYPRHDWWCGLVEDAEADAEDITGLLP